MAVYSKIPFSGSTTGRGVKIANTTTTIHTPASSVTDEIWAWAVNSSTSDVKLTNQFGGTTDPDDHIELTIPAESGLILVVPGLILSAAINYAALAATTNVIVVFGYVNRIT